MKFTFKTEKSTGKYRAFFSPTHDIKLDGVVCGSINADPPHTVRFMKVKDDIAEDENTNCEWRWVKIKMPFGSVNEAKAWVLGNSEKIQTQINIYACKGIVKDNTH